MTKYKIKNTKIDEITTRLPWLLKQQSQCHKISHNPTKYHTIPHNLTQSHTISHNPTRSHTIMHYTTYLIIDKIAMKCKTVIPYTYIYHDQNTIHCQRLIFPQIPPNLTWRNEMTHNPLKGDMRCSTTSQGVRAQQGENHKC